MDWEDLAVGPCPAGSCVYIGDFGDNNMQRDDYVIYRVAEPSTTTGGSLDAEAFPFSYPDESHDAESLFWADGALHIITKQLTTVSQVFRLPPLGDGNLVAEELLGAFLPPEGVLAVTGADANEQGILVRTYTSLWFYRTLGPGVVEGLSGEPCSLPVSPEGQGEAVAWRRDAQGDVELAAALDGPARALVVHDRTSRSLRRLDPASGRAVWSAEVPTAPFEANSSSFLARPLLGDGQVLVEDTSSVVTVLDLADGAPVVTIDGGADLDVRLSDPLLLLRDGELLAPAAGGDQ